MVRRHVSSPSMMAVRHWSSCAAPLSCRRSWVGGTRTGPWRRRPRAVGRPLRGARAMRARRRASEPLCRSRTRRRSSLRPDDGCAGFPDRSRGPALVPRHALDAPDRSTEGSVWAQVSKSSRQRVRAAEKAEIIVRSDGDGDRLDEFSGLLVERAEALAIKLRPELGFLAAWRRFIALGHARVLV